ncbi:MAG: type II secretion system F family protein [Sedimentisphaerales bacterium]|nr:type II secretion system F family protein [Sedimentisphaerales bacterium]
MMTVYDYTAKDRGGKKVVGTYDDIDSVALLRQELDKMGYILLKARRHKDKTRKHRKIKQPEVVTFIYKFAEMYSAGLSITRSLEVLEEQSHNSEFRNVIADIKQNIENGSSLEKAFGLYRNIFSDFFCGMLEAGESGGKLSESLEMSAVYLEKRLDMRRRIRSALTYPIIVSVICIAVIGCLIAFIVPIFSKLYKRLQVPLPVPTRILVLLSAVIRDYWWAIPFVLAALIALLWWLMKNPKSRAMWDAFKLKMPVLGNVNRMIVVSHFMRTFGMLTSVGISPIRALDVASDVAHNHSITGITRQLKETIEKGLSIGDSFRKHDIFPPIIVQLALSGEEVGQVPQMLNKGADFLDKDISRALDSLIVKLEPALTVIMGTIIGVILMAVYLPMFDYMQHLK